MRNCALEKLYYYYFKLYIYTIYTHFFHDFISSYKDVYGSSFFNYNFFYFSYGGFCVDLAAEIIFNTETLIEILICCSESKRKSDIFIQSNLHCIQCSAC